MIVRIVFLEFQDSAIETFKHRFVESKPKILARDGCHHVELLQDINKPNHFFTYSHWDSEEALNAYRKSEFFGEIWPKTKALLCSSPKAWSLQSTD